MSLFLIAALGLVMDGAQIYAHRQMAQDAADAAAQAGIMIFTSTNVTGGNPFGTGTSPGAHTCTTTDPITPCVYARNNGFGGSAADQLQGNPGSTTTIIGEIITDNLQLGGTAGIKMNLNPNSSLHIRQVALVR